MQVVPAKARLKNGHSFDLSNGSGEWPLTLADHWPLTAESSQLTSGFVGCGDVRLGDQLSEGDSGEDHERAGGGSGGEALVQDQERCDPGEDRLHGEDERGVRGGQDGLRPALDGEGGGGGEDRGDGEGRDEARRPDHVHRAEADLQQREGAEVDARGIVRQCDAVEGESECAADREEVSYVDGGEI